MNGQLYVERCAVTGRFRVEADGEAAERVEVVETAVRAEAHGRPELDLEGLELDSGMAAAHWHDLVRRLRDQHGSVTLVHAPQMLAHTLYKVGGLLDGRILLQAPRSDEGFTAG